MSKSTETSVAHLGDWQAKSFYPDGLASWRPEVSPDIPAGQTTGRLRGCSYCGSMHPADLAAAIKAGAVASWADFKYGWPHKAYVRGVPNPHAGMLESRMSCSHATPVCKYTGKSCEHGEQNDYRPHPSCTCMAPGFAGDAPTEGVTARGERMVRIPDGYDRNTGKPQFRWTEAGKPAAIATDGKFYTVHLQDASPEDCATIEAHLGLAFTFSEGRVSWRKVEDDSPGAPS